jgi:exodeoxyribonuclease VII large subunit
MIDARPVVYTVSQLNRYIKSMFDNDFNMQTVFLEGEISNFTNHRSGHLYFTLKDEQAVIKAVMFKSSAIRLKFAPADSMKVIVRGRISVYEASGQYQVYVDDMQPQGIGELALAFEQLKEKLGNEGLFDREHKKAIPRYPERVGVITSPTGAALQDILNILNRRFKYSEVVFCPALVQGEGSAQSLIEALRLFNEKKAADVIIIGRGGGSIEDLWSFNDEALAREIYKSDIPVISAVGHETDFTICDFVADLRAETPSAAAEYAVPKYEEQAVYLDKLKKELLGNIRYILESENNRLNALVNSDALKNPIRSVELKRILLDSLSDRLNKQESTILSTKRLELAGCASKLNALSPLNVLSRGYSVAYKDGKVIKEKKDININDELTLKLSDGEALCAVKEIR